jgi:hypothetical protein
MADVPKVSHSEPAIAMYFLLYFPPHNLALASLILQVGERTIVQQDDMIALLQSRASEACSPTAAAPAGLPLLLSSDPQRGRLSDDVRACHFGTSAPRPRIVISSCERPSVAEPQLERHQAHSPPHFERRPSSASPVARVREGGPGRGTTRHLAGRPTGAWPMSPSATAEARLAHGRADYSFTGRETSKADLRVTRPQSASTALQHPTWDGADRASNSLPARPPSSKKTLLLLGLASS